MRQKNQPNWQPEQQFWKVSRLEGEKKGAISMNDFVSADKIKRLISIYQESKLEALKVGDDQCAENMDHRIEALEILLKTNDSFDPLDPNDEWWKGDDEE